ncbi:MULTISPECIES: NAD(P)/FAD-dependent oxidoreductase [unclassified Agarivorans]|uniref:NAD(P)/FAD-dependent oxidoreductase n=1 Tax=unclassified Agarivorans TaxID=2636026 RepID=UPI0026E2173C|nr:MULTISPECIES: FAD-binding oxidoreductase [unclassified Agarivorans]MDO6685680.1 FAD-binding oxidoreductase [Agarivorans sp. 3_MG-2023]MDO6716205.1 FAD-binding oxidoreductase [Agarivorans sp. 2_MG-2023]
MLSHTASYYAASANNTRQFPQLQQHIRCDVCIIGAGFSGLSSALHLAEKGFHVVILESVKVGFGATGRNGGQIVNSYSRDVDVIEQRYDKNTAQALNEMIFEGGEIIRSRIADYHIECDYQQGGVFAAYNAKQLKGLAEQKANWERFGNHQLELLDKAQLAKVVGTQAYQGGLLDMKGGHIHSLNLALGEAEAILSLGGEIYEQSAVLDYQAGEPAKVTTEHGSVRANYLLFAGNAYLGELEPKLSDKAIRCGTQVVATEPLSDDLCEQLLPQNYCVEDCNYLLDYYRISGDKRLLFGGGVVYGAKPLASIEKQIRPKFEALFPQLTGVNIDYAWTGNFLLTYSRMPQFGRLDSNIYYLQGYSGHGLTCTHLAGKLLAEVLSEQSQRFDVFASLNHYRFPGGRHLQVPFTALGAVYYNLRDKLGI